MPETSNQLTRKTLIRDVLSLLAAGYASVGVNDNLAKVVETVVTFPKQHVLPVVDNDGRLAGIIRLSTVCGEALAHLAPELLIADIDTLEEVLQFTDLEIARTARELMQPAVSIHEDARLVDAFRLLHSEKVTALPIADKDGHLIGVIDAVQLLSLWVNQGASSATHDG